MKNFLRDIKILDLTTLLPGSLCTLILQDLGADVIKIENPEKPDTVRFIPPMAGEMSSLFHCLNRGKKSIAINLKKEKGREIFLKLVQSADCIVEGFRPAVMQRLALSYNKLKNIKKDIIYCSISGFGQKGKYSQRPGHDLTYIAISGLLSLFKEKVPLPLQVADVGGGALNAAISIISALLYREKTKKGCYLDVSITEGTLIFLFKAFSDLAISGFSLPQGKDPLSGAFPFYNIYQTKDNEFITIAALEDKFRDKFYEIISSIKGERNITEEDIKKIIKMNSSKFWMEIFIKSDIPAEIVLPTKKVLKHPCFKDRSSFITIKTKEKMKITIPKTPFLFEKKNLKPAPSFGEHTNSILKKLGFDEKQIEEFKRENVVK